MRERAPSYWQLRVFEATDPLTGKKKYRTKYVRGGKRAAQSALAAFVAEVDAGVISPRIVTASDLLDAWLAHKEHLAGRRPRCRGTGGS